MVRHAALIFLNNAYVIRNNLEEEIIHSLVYMVLNGVFVILSVIINQESRRTNFATVGIFQRRKYNDYAIIPTEVKKTG
jgi:hypothetical protein